MTLNASKILQIVTVYNPSGNFSEQLVSDFTELTEIVSSFGGCALYTGDFNFHVDISSDPIAIKFLKLLTSLGLKQHDLSPTHREGHTLDLVISGTDLIVSSIKLSI